MAGPTADSGGAPSAPRPLTGRPAPHLPWTTPPRRLRERLRQGATVTFVSMVLLSGYGTLTPPSVRCGLPGDVGCPGGLLGPLAPLASSNLTQWFNISMYDYGFWIVDTVSGANETSHWTVYEGYTVHVNATSLPPDRSVGGTAYHGIGVELNATGQQLLSVAAPVGRTVAGSFVAPNHPYYRQHIWCTIECGPGHGGMQAFNLYIVPATAFPSATATAEPSSGAAPLPVTFLGGASGGSPPYNFTWNFGDGSSASYLQNTSHTYAYAGTYQATFSVVDSKQNSAVGTATVTVTKPTPLAVTVQWSSTGGTAPLLVEYAATASGGFAPYRYAWIFGDGTVSPSSSGGHLYSVAGDYTALLTVTDSHGGAASASRTVAVTSATGTLTVSATATPSHGTAPLVVHFQAPTTGGSGSYSSEWIFGDGAFGQGAAPSHTYSERGDFVVTVFVIDDTGKVGSAQVPVNVSGPTGTPLRVGLTELPSGGSPPLTVEAAASVFGGSGTYSIPSWSFGDGAVSQGVTSTHQYATVGTFNLSVTVTDGTGASASNSTQVTVAGLGLTIALNRTLGDAPFSVSASASVVGGAPPYGAVTWQWGDGTGTVGNPLNHTYPAETVHTVIIQAAVQDANGSIASGSVTVTILPPPVAILVANATEGHSVPFPVTFRLTVTSGSGNYSTSPLWNFGDGTTTRGAGPLNHTYHKLGRFHVSVETNDSLGGIASATVWVNVTIASLNGGGGDCHCWSFTGIGDPDSAALVLLGFVGASGLLVVYKDRPRRPPVPPPARRGPGR